jgi:hypothetical protein
MKRFMYLLFALSILALFSCKNNKESSYNEDIEIPDSIGQEEQPIKVSDEAMENIVQNVASPIEMAALVKSLGVPFSKDYLASTKNTNEYVTNFSKAFNLGVFGADLGYINMYNQQSMVLDYITAIKKLSDGINVGQFFDFPLLKRLAKNSQNLDSLMYISIHSFNKMDSYLRENNRGGISAAIVAGVWVEGLYLSTQVAKEKDSEKLNQAIGEQKTILNELMIILNNYHQEPYMADLIEEILKVKAIFDNIKITIEVGEPESIVKDGKLTIIQNEKSIVHISDEQLNTIIQKTQDIRTKLVSIK